MRTCTKCQRELDKTEFYTTTVSGRKYLRGACKDCYRATELARRYKMRCTCCGMWLKLQDFYYMTVNGQRYRRRQCKVCRRDKAQAWKRKNAERVQAYNREYYADNAAYLREVNLEAWHTRTRERKRAILAGIRRIEG